jgi:hypothetical protein
VHGQKNRFLPALQLEQQIDTKAMDWLSHAGEKRMKRNNRQMEEPLLVGEITEYERSECCLGTASQRICQYIRRSLKACPPYQDKCHILRWDN